MKASTKNLIVLFPGAGYTVGNPLLYYADLKYYTKGYECIKINYGDCIRKDISWDKVIKSIKNYVLKQTNRVDFSMYDDILFVSKSLGTVIAGWLDDIKGVNARHIYLTPINETLQYMKNGKNISIVIAGTKDNFMDTTTLTDHCKNENVKLKLIENAGHSLEIESDMSISIDILKEVVETY